MNKTTNTTNEEKDKLQPFPFIENEDYLLKLKNGMHIIAYWEKGKFILNYSDDYVEEEIESIVALKDLGIYCELPAFEKGTMHKGMETDKAYTLEDLEL